MDTGYYLLAFLYKRLIYRNGLSFVNGLVFVNGSRLKDFIFFFVTRSCNARTGNS